MDDDYGALIAEGNVHVAAEDGRIAGVIVLRADGDHLLVENVAVDPPFQGRGCGRALLAFAEAHAISLGLGELRLYTNAAMKENLGMYRHLGWEEYDRHSRSGFSRVYLRKQLEAPDS